MTTDQKIAFLLVIVAVALNSSVLIAHTWNRHK